MSHRQICFIYFYSDTERWRDDGKCGRDYPLRSGEPSECNPTGDKPCCNERLKSCGNTEDYCICDECRDYRPTESSDCEISEVGGFLKYKCYNQKLKDHYKCARSDIRYNTNLDTWVDSRGISIITTTSKVCENDPYAYQACGFGTLITIRPTLCGGNFSQDGRYNEFENPLSVSSGECDGVCDLTSITCSDESDCGGYFYGLKCVSSGEAVYAPVHWICNNVIGCDDELDEMDCEPSTEKENCTHYYAKTILKKDITVPISNFTRCAAFDIENGIYPYCIGFKDQTNCTDENRIGGICKLEKTNTQISINMVCYNYKMNQTMDNFCDDGSESFCETFQSGLEKCVVHKHRMCDNSTDCHDGSDEFNDECKLMTEDFSCKRKFSRYNESIVIPVSWLLDKQEDCVDGEDENILRWEEYFPGSSQTRYVIPKGNDTRHTEFFICDATSSTSLNVRMDLMCDGGESCGKENQVETNVCRYSRDLFSSLRKIAPKTGPATKEISDLCTDVIDTNREGHNCELKEFQNKVKIFGVTKWVNLPKDRVNCKDKFGEFYVYLSCMDRCRDANCPLGETPLKHDACPLGQYPDRIYTLAGEKDLTFVTKSCVGGKYKNDYFQCKNERCVEYSQVCDLTNDCGDWSDEANCANSILCSNGKNRISLQQQCDGIVDCSDYSDECNDRCGMHISTLLAIICFILGIFATMFNVILISRTVHSFKSIKTGNMFDTKILITTIALGDLLMGIYLIATAFFNINTSALEGSNYCFKSKAEWLSSRECSVLGIISTIGSQTSLFAMTVLSITRYLGLTSTSLKPPSPVNKKAIIKSSMKVAMILALSATIALIPLAPSLEDYFVEGIYYESENNIFLGIPNKEKHVKVLKAYYGQQLNMSYDMAWRDIFSNMEKMFSNPKETMRRRKVHYYGNDQLCLFKYFVSSYDARRMSRQSLQKKTGVLDYIDFERNRLLWCVLAVNFVCFIVMSISYVRITIQTWKSSSSSGQSSNFENTRRKEKIELKISLIIATDFLCWIPFITVCALHNFQFIDASYWYAYFAIVLLPVNSVINPMLYDDTITGFLVSKTQPARARIISFVRMIHLRASDIFSRSTKRVTVPHEGCGGRNFEGGSSVNLDVEENTPDSHSAKQHDSAI